MKLISGIILSGFLFANVAMAKTWVAVCNDDKNVQYNQTENGNGFLYMKVKDGQGTFHIYQVAKLKQTFFDGAAICGTVLENGNGSTGVPITQICANQREGKIYVKYKHPYEPSKPFESGVFCDAAVRVPAVRVPAVRVQ
ncbi:MAG: hypothetical protein HYW48_11530 [Deltaproteobacteria bacterium]|nr:hypothetical protein [Deltaproteobacteria bacterium]